MSIIIIILRSASVTLPAGGGVTLPAGGGVTLPTGGGALENAHVKLKMIKEEREGLLMIYTNNSEGRLRPPTTLVRLAKTPQSVITNRTLRGVKLFCCTGICIYIIFIIIITNNLSLIILAHVRPLKRR
jgi:hypothetical protein